MPTVPPKKIPNKFYKTLREFTAWPTWGTRPPHNNGNTDFIPVDGVFVNQFDYPAEMKKLMDHGWRTAKKPTTAPGNRAGITIGRSAALQPPGRPATGPGAAPQLPGRPAIGRPSAPAPSPQPLLRTAMGLHGLHADWDHIKLFRQVAAYTFRGDRRPPEAIMAADGFHPPASRTDAAFMKPLATEFADFYAKKNALALDPVARGQLIGEIEQYLTGQMPSMNRRMLVEYHFWRQILKGQEMHLKGMTNDSFLKAYVSTSRDPSVALLGAGGMLGGGAQGAAPVGPGFMYAVRVNPGFLLVTGVGGVTKKEAEVSHLGPIRWRDVIAFRSMMPGESTVYVRNLFDQQDYKAFQQVLGGLSDPTG
jgi:hypothetical protein